MKPISDAMVETEWWRQFLLVWADVSERAFADLSSDCDETEIVFDPELPEALISGDVAKKFVFGRTDLGDYRNKIKNVHGHPIGVTVHVKRSVGPDGRPQNSLTIEDFGGECPVINVATTSTKKVILNVGRFPAGGGDIETHKMELE